MTQDISLCISVKVVGNKNNDSLVFSFIVEYTDSLQGSLIILLVKFGTILLKYSLYSIDYAMN